MTTLFEVSWEVCNKVGGIYTVVASKALEMGKHYDQHILIGPYIPEQARGVFEELPAPTQCIGCVEELAKSGIKIHVGKWLIKGSPLVILVDHSDFRSNTNNIKSNLWNKYKLDTLQTQFYDFDEPLIWSWAVGKVIDEWSGTVDDHIIIQAHEWLSGGAILYAKEHIKNAATVFTTHATMLGRTLASHGEDLYGTLDSLNAEEKAKQFGPTVWAKFQLERLLANQAHVFTTVSKITALEAEKILGKRPDVILPNGLDSAQFPSLEDSGIRRQHIRDKIEEFMMHYFFPYYSFDLDETVLMFTGGRYEFRDKGLDVFCDALGKLNEELKAEECKKSVVVFFLVPAGARGMKRNVIENRALFNDVRETLSDYRDHVNNRITQLILSDRPISKETLFSEDVLVDLTIKSRRFKQSGTPPVITHDLQDEEFDPILRAFKKAGLDNAKENPVKVVFYPLYLSGADGLLDLTYYEITSGCDLGIFASYYEPWGYTPLEAAAHAVPSITTDLAGFGAYVQELNHQEDIPGVTVLPRKDKSDETVVAELTRALSQSVHQPKSTLDIARLNAKRIANNTDWKNFVKYYLEAHNLALKRLKQ